MSCGNSYVGKYGWIETRKYLMVKGVSLYK
jgi:hypothetical protein